MSDADMQLMELQCVGALLGVFVLALAVLIIFANRPSGLWTKPPRFFADYEGTGHPGTVVEDADWVQAISWIFGIAALLAFFISIPYLGGWMILLPHTILCVIAVQRSETLPGKLFWVLAWGFLAAVFWGLK